MDWDAFGKAVRQLTEKEYTVTHKYIHNKLATGDIIHKRYRIYGRIYKDD